MNTKKQNSTDTQGQQNKTKKDYRDEQAFNPFDKSQNTTSARETLEEEANAEQQRKETLTERD
jgi:hypothetical protein